MIRTYNKSVLKNDAEAFAHQLASLLGIETKLNCHYSYAQEDEKNE